MTGRRRRVPVGPRFRHRQGPDRIEDGQTVKSIGRNTVDSDGDDITDIDVELDDEIVESKSTISESEALSKLQGYEDADAAGELDLDGKTVTFDLNSDLSPSSKSNIRTAARQLENRNNGIDDIEIEFDSTDPVDTE